MSAVLMEGASLTPSPVIAVTEPACCQAFTMRVLCSGCTRAYTEMFRNSRSNSAWLMSSSCDPVTARCPSSKMPSSRAMAVAVSTWSPVIIMGRMPALRHWAMASFTSGRTGSIIPARPRKVSSRSRLAGEVSAGTLSQIRQAAHNTRSARPAMAWLAARIS